MTYEEKIKKFFVNVKVPIKIIIKNGRSLISSNCLKCFKELFGYKRVYLCKKCSNSGVFNPRSKLNKCLICKIYIKSRYKFCSRDCHAIYRSNYKTNDKNIKKYLRRLNHRSREMFKRKYGIIGLPLNIIKAQIYIEMSKSCIKA